MLLEIPPSALPASTRWLDGATITDAELAQHVSCPPSRAPRVLPPCLAAGVFSALRTSFPWPQVSEKADGDFVRVLPDGCLHLHLRSPLPMKAVNTFPLELERGEHKFPPECR